MNKETDARGYEINRLTYCPHFMENIKCISHFYKNKLKSEMAMDGILI
jgi:hypothetical protein